MNVRALCVNCASIMRALAKIARLKTCIHQQAVHYLDWLLPCACVLCGKLSCNNYNLCSACEQELPTLQHVCTQCGKALAGSYTEVSENRISSKAIVYESVRAEILDDLDMLTENEEVATISDDIVQPNHLLCGACIKQTPPFDITISPYHYSSPIDHLILGLKFGNRLINAKLLGAILAKHLQQAYEQGTNKLATAKPEAILPIPLHKTRLRERGYNQALELARPISHLLNIPIDVINCQRAKNTPAQSLLNARARKDNIRGAFVVKRPLPYQHVAVIDDVITTGSTVREFCHKLRDAGANRIDVWSCAQT